MCVCVFLWCLMSCFCKPCWQRTSDSLFASDCTVSQMVCAPDFVSAVQPLLGLSGRAGTAPLAQLRATNIFTQEERCTDLRSA